MADIVIQSNDKIQFVRKDFREIQLQKAITLTLNGTGPITVDGQQVCQDADVETFKETNVAYFIGIYEGGTGTISVVQQLLTYTEHATGDGPKKYILHKPFTAQFEVDVPASCIEKNTGTRLEHTAPGFTIKNTAKKFTLKNNYLHIQMT